LLQNNLIELFDKHYQNKGSFDFNALKIYLLMFEYRFKTIYSSNQYWIDLFMNNLKIKDNIEFISASNKLKDCNIKQKTKYSERKKLGISKCLETISSDFRFNEHLHYFNSHKKKDDLSDSFLQGIWFINSFK
jgi:hypothetical protein